MKRIKLFYILLILTAVSCRKYNKYEGVPFPEKEIRDWENPAVNQIGREEPHASLISFPDEASALESIKSESPAVMSLD